MLSVFKGRTLRKFDDSCNCPQEYCDHDRTVVDTADQADLVGSDLKGSSDIHMPVLDLDVPAALWPSATPGHTHLYIDVKVPWKKYVALLNALAAAGIIEVGFADASINRGFSSVRVPWKPKQIEGPF